MIERRGVEVHGVERGAEMVLVTLAAAAARDRGVESTAGVDPRREERVAVEAPGVRDATLTELVALGAIAHSLEAGMRPDQLAGREQLRVGRRHGRGEQEDGRQGAPA
jgi:hypothetical protein